jgi:hypothetical protein
MTVKLISRELKTFKENKSQLLKKAEGKFVLIHQDRIIDIFETEDEGIRAGYQQLGNTPFLVKEILEKERVAVVGGN